MKLILGFVCFYVLMQLFLPVRHWFIPGDVNWTEEGYRMSWHMMLRSKRGTGYFKMVDKKTDSTWQVSYASFLHPSQVVSVATHPDMTWQAAQYVKEQYEKKQRHVAIFAHNEVSLNYHPSRLIIDTSTDLANTQWKRFGHNEWILLY